MKLILILAMIAVQFGPRPPLTPAETLIEPEMLRAIERASVEGADVAVIAGSDSAAGEIALACGAGQCEAIQQAARRLGPAIAARQIPQPARTIRVTSSHRQHRHRTHERRSSSTDRRDAAFNSFADCGRPPASGRSRRDLRAGRRCPLWKCAPSKTWPTGLGHVRHPDYGDRAAARFRDLDRASFIAAASAYFLATLPNGGRRSACCRT